MNEELKPCPFCGNTNVKAWNLAGDDWFVECEKNYVKQCGCGMSLHAIHPTREAAISAWNTRARTVEAATLHMAVDRLGGTVEGAPTQPMNFLQRIDELRAIENERDELREARGERDRQYEFNAGSIARIAELENALQKEIKWHCQDCREERPLFVEPSTGKYTHRLGGNYCSSDTFHRLLGTVPGEQ